MKLALRAAGISVAVAGLSAAQVATSPQRTEARLEAAASQAGAHVRASRHLGVLESGESRAEFTALVVANAILPGTDSRGIRIDFSIPGWKQALYLDEQQVHYLKEAMDKVAVDVARRAPGYANSLGEGYIGVCDMANQPERFPITVDYRVSWYPALVMRTPTLMIFPDRTPADLAAILAKAVEYLAEQ